MLYFFFHASAFEGVCNNAGKVAFVVCWKGRCEQVATVITQANSATPSLPFFLQVADNKLLGENINNTLPTAIVLIASLREDGR